jgi:ADP-heptose:LPS heptosyltransferase
VFKIFRRNFAEWIKENRLFFYKSIFFIKRPFYERKRSRLLGDQATYSSDKKILIVMNGGLGNAIQASPIAQCIRMLWPKSYICICTPSGDLFENWNVVDEICCLDSPPLETAYDLTIFTWAFEEYPWFDDIIFGVQRKIRFYGAQFLRPERDYYMDTVRRLGYVGSAPPYFCNITKPHDIKKIDRLICVVPGSKNNFRWRNKRWPYFAELISNLLVAYPHYRIAIIGTVEDTISLEASSGRIDDYRGRLSLSETAWVLSRSDIAIGNDCGPMHIADAVRVPSVVIFGPSCELKNGPRNNGIVLSSAVACRPCQYSESLLNCDSPICMSEISVGDVTSIIKELVR